jgi:twitching motility protein PilT
VRAQLSLTLQGVLSQQLIVRQDERGRVLALEIMIPNPAIRNLIREAKIHQVYTQMQVGQSRFGMQTMSQSLLELYSRKVISYDEAIAHATEPEELRPMLGDPPPFARAGGLAARR